METESLVDLEVMRCIEEALAKFGCAGHVSLWDGHAVLQGAGSRVEVPLGGLIEQWDRLSPPVRDRRCTALARELASLRRQPGAEVSEQARGGLVTHFVRGGIALLLVVLCWIGYAWLAPWLGSDPAAQAADAGAAPAPQLSSTDSARAQRAAAVCERTQTRFQQGATPGPSDVEGWLVELLLLREPGEPGLLHDPRLASFFAPSQANVGRRVVWPRAPVLHATTGPSTSVELADASIGRHPRIPGVRVTFHGRYVVPYFDAAQRSEFFQLADALAERLGAQQAALYARCAHRSTHHLGSWFRGKGVGKATAALIYAMGLSAAVPHVAGFDPKAAGPEGWGRAWRAIQDATAEVSRTQVTGWLARDGGMVAGRDEGIAYLHFPFSDANRASRGSQVVAAALHLLEPVRPSER